MEGIVPEVEGPLDSAKGAERQKWKRQACRACYKELQALVGPLVNKLSHLKVLDNGMWLSSSWEVKLADYPAVLKRVTTPDDEVGDSKGGDASYSVFRLEKW